MKAKVIPFKKANKQISQVINSNNEEELKNKWLVPILQNHYHPSQDGVHYEKRVLKGRVDVRFMFEGRTRGVIELKSPHVALDVGSKDFDIFFQQAHKYAHAFYVWRKGILFPIQGILTNGHVAWIFDGGLEFAKAKASARKINLDSESGYKEFYEIISSMKKPKPHSNLSKIIERLSPNVDSADSILAKELYKWYLELNKRVRNREESLDLTLQLYLIAICRDCGFVPTARIAQFESQKNWSGIVEELKKLFSYQFISLPKTEQAYLWELYHKTRSVPVRLDTFPPDSLGTVYEKLVREIKGKDCTKTSFYTPVELIDEVIDSVKLKKEDRVLDPTAGSAAFLVGCIQKLFPNETEFSEIKKYIEKNIVGIDIDQYACIVGKASILSAYATTLPYDPVDDLKIPKINFYCHDFFDKKSLGYGKFDVVVGNPPWGSIDSKKILSNLEVKKTLSAYSVYKRKSDICIFIYERAYNLLSQNGRMGMVCKLQTTSGIQHENFINWWKDRVYKVIDYGDEKLFNNEAQTAIIMASKKSKGNPVIVQKNKKQAIYFKGKEIGHYFDLVQGWQSGGDEIYEKFANQFPNHPLNVKVLKNKKMGFFYVNLSTLPQTSLICNTTPSDFIKWLSKNDRKKLEDRAEIKRNRSRDKYAWTWTYSKDKIKFNGTQIRLLTPRVWSSERVPCVIDEKGSLASITSLTLLIPKKDTPKEIIYLTSAWISSKYFHAHARDIGKPMGNGGLALYPAYLSKCIVPEWKNMKSIAKIVKNILKSKSQPTDITLKKIDNLILNALKGLNATGISTTKIPASISKHQSVLNKAKAVKGVAKKKSKKESKRA